MVDQTGGVVIYEAAGPALGDVLAALTAVDLHPSVFPLGSALCFGLYQLLTRMLANSDSPTTSNFYAGLCNTLALSALVPFFW